jgi:hypothetical protein
VAGDPYGAQERPRQPAVTRTVYVLAFHDEPGRAFCQLSSHHISFNTSGHREFATQEEAEQFRTYWRDRHFFRSWDSLRVTRKDVDSPTHP